MIWHSSHEVLNAIPVFEAWKTQSCVFFFQHVVIICLHTLLPDPTLDIFVLITRRKWVVGIVLKVRLKGTLSIVFPWLSNVIAQQSAGAWVWFRAWLGRWRWLRLRVCNVFNVFKKGKCIEVFDWIVVSVIFTTLSGINPSGCAANCQILLACNLKLFRMV